MGFNPEPGAVYSISSGFRKIEKSSLKLGQRVSYGDMANPRQVAVVVEAEGTAYGQKCIFVEDFHASQVSLTSVESLDGWKLESGIVTSEAIEVLKLHHIDRMNSDRLKWEQAASDRAAGIIRGKDENFAHVRLTRLCGCNYKQPVKYRGKSVYVPDPQTSQTYRLDAAKFKSGGFQSRDSWAITVWCDDSARICESEAYWQD